MIVIRLPDITATRRLGVRLGRVLGPGDVLDLRGEVGAGKTALAQAVLTGFLGPGVYRSPSFVLVQSYPGGIAHADLYRLSPAQAAALRLDELVEPEDRLIVEWGERTGMERLPDRLEVHLRGRRGRRAFLRPTGAQGRALAERALGAWTLPRPGRGHHR